MSVHGQIAHQTSGRVRIDLPAKRGDASYFSTLSQQIAGLDEVLAVRTNPITASLIVEYDGPFDALLRRFDDMAIDILSQPAKTGLNDGGASHEAFASDSALPYRIVSGRQVHPMLLVGLAFGALGLVQMARGQVLVPALSAFWYAARAFRLAKG
jgi:hypothetical protein